jgi:hypothetical protein
MQGKTTLQGRRSKVKHSPFDRRNSRRWSNTTTVGKRVNKRKLASVFRSIAEGDYHASLALFRLFFVDSLEERAAAKRLPQINNRARSVHQLPRIARCIKQDPGSRTCSALTSTTSKFIRVRLVVQEGPRHAPVKPLEEHVSRTRLTIDRQAEPLSPLLPMKTL